MKRLTLRRNHSDEAMKRLTMLKNWSNEAFNASLPRFIASLLSTLYMSMQKLPKNRAKFSQKYVRAKTMMFFSFATETMKNNKFLGKLPLGFIASSLLCITFLFVKALRQWWQIRGAMKRWNRYYRASSHRFIASIAQLWRYHVTRICLFRP